MSETIPETIPEAPPIKLSDLIKSGLEAGLHPNEIRRKLQVMGVRWRYNFSGINAEGRRVQVVGKREKARRLRQLSQCEEGCGQWAPPGRTPRICDDCLAAKWAV